MSWLFSRALVEEFSEAICSDGEQFAQLNVVLTQQPFWRRDKTTDASNHSQFGLTSRLLTDAHGAALLTSFLGASPAKTSVPPEKVSASMESEAGSGRTWPGLLAKFDPATSSWKTAQCSLLAGLDEFSETWPRWGTMRSGVCWERARPDFLTVESASGSSLPTPSGVNGGNNNTMGRVDEWGGSSNPLRGTVIGSMCLPEFEELVMGWPVTWTELTPFETGRFHAWLRQHSPSLPIEHMKAAA